MTVDQTDRWIDDATAFVLDEVDEEGGRATHTLRINAADVISEAIDTFGNIALAAVLNAANTLIETGLKEREAQNSEWWKPCEAALLAYAPPPNPRHCFHFHLPCLHSHTTPATHARESLGCSQIWCCPQPHC
jgi:hypothetical protein